MIRLRGIDAVKSGLIGLMIVGALMGCALATAQTSARDVLAANRAAMMVPQQGNLSATYAIELEHPTGFLIGGCSLPEVLLLQNALSISNPA
jgi:uncharacterized protein YcnI